MDSPGRHLPVHPLTDPLDVDVVIVGAGISGAFMAHALAGDLTVVVLDRRRPVLGSTLASTALLQWELDQPLIRLADQIGAADASRTYRRAYRAVGDLMTIVRRERIRCGLNAKSSLYLAGDAYGSRALRQEAEARMDIGLPSTFLPPAALGAQFGLQRTGAILSEGAASADPACLAAGLLRRAAARGAELHAPVEAREILQGKDHVTVVTDAGVEVRARHVVFCCGYEFPKGVPTPGAKVISTWALASQPSLTVPAWIADHLVWEASDPYLYVRKTRDGRLIVGGEDEASASAHADPSRLRSKANTLVRKLCALVPDLEITPDYAWAGAFGETVTSMPLISAVPDMPRCFVVMGFGGNGITYSVIASQVISTAIRGQTDPDADLFALPSA